MLKLILGKNWCENRNNILSLIADDVAHGKNNCVLMVPELISHDMERRLCDVAGPAASRYAEVLSFTRLARRVADDAGHSAMPCLDEGGRVVAMAAAIVQVRSKLKFFASVGTKPEFISGLVETVDECKRCNVDAKSLMRASSETTGTLAQKLEELSFIFEAYDGICQHGKKDPRDQLTWLLEELETGSYAQEHIFYFDGFSDFTRQQLEILKHLICYSTGVTVTLTCPAPSTGSLAFERPGETAAELIRIANSMGVNYEVVYLPDVLSDIDPVADMLFEGNVTDNTCERLHVYRSESVFEECEELAQRILELVQSGVRYRDICVVCPSMEEYTGPLTMIFGRSGIPAYLSGTVSILERPVIATLLCGVDAALSGFDRKDVLAYLKTALSPLSIHESDLIENYALLWSVTGKKWTQPWTMHPRGLVNEWTDADHALLNQLNALRQRLITPLLSLRQSFLCGKNVAQQVVGLYTFLEEIHVAKRLADLADQLEAANDLQNAQVLDQIWEILVNAFEQMHDVLGESIWEPEALSKLLRILLSRYDVGTIPATLDSVTVGSVNAMHCMESMHLFVLGALEGALPGYGSSSGVLTDQDRVALRGLGVPLNGGAIDSMQTSFSEIYGVFRGASESVTVSCPGGQPSYIYLRMKTLSGEEDAPIKPIGAAMINKKHAAAYLLRHNDRRFARDLGIEADVELIESKRSHVHGVVSSEHVQKLYGKQFRLSASQIDRHANCAMSYFLNYGLKAKERKPAQVDPAEFGTFVHDVLEKTATEVVEKGGFKQVTREEALTIAVKYANEYTKQHFADLDSERLIYLLRRNGRELDLIVEELWKELNASEFAPIMFELSFGGESADFPPIHIQGSLATANLRGFVDRVDVWKTETSSYFRVVDYKTGVKAFDYCDIINGIGLQMLLYMFALAQSDSDLLGEDPVPAGVQYFPARVPLVSVESPTDTEEIVKKRDAVWKRSGLLLRQDDVLNAMEPGETPIRMPYKRKKDGTLSGDLADRSQLELLKKFVFRYLQKMVDDIASGNVAANPYTRDARKNACRFCPYGQICHKNDVTGRRVFEAISAERFWNDLTEEVRGHG